MRRAGRGGRRAGRLRSARAFFPSSLREAGEGGLRASAARYQCIECGAPYAGSAFTYYGGRIEDGPAYWSDRGLLCGAACSVAHFARRRAEGTMPVEPAPEPFGHYPLSP